MGSRLVLKVWGEGLKASREESYPVVSETTFMRENYYIIRNFASQLLHRAIIKNFIHLKMK